MEMRYKIKINFSSVQIVRVAANGTPDLTLVQNRNEFALQSFKALL